MLPEGYGFDEKGLFKMVKSVVPDSEVPRYLCDGIPYQARKVRIIDDQKQCVTEGYSFKIRTREGVSEESLLCTVDEVNGKELISKISNYIVFYPIRGIRLHLQQVFEYDIKTQAKEQEVLTLYVNNYGWHGNMFAWGHDEPNPDTAKQYANAVDICMIMSRVPAVMVAVLAAVHEILKKLLQRAGITHDYTDLYVGETGVGKSSLVRLVCGQNYPQNNIISLNSDRKILRRLVSECTDMTIVLDDHFSSTSDRINASLMQTVTELIQAASDSGALLVDGQLSGVVSRNHQMITAQETIRNEATMNRCFVYRMDEPLEKETYQQLCSAAERGVFQEFKVGISYFCSAERFEGQVSMMKKDYEYFKSMAVGLGDCSPGSDNRINETFAVQMVLAKVIIRYLKWLNISGDILGRTESVMYGCVKEVCKIMKGDIRELRKTEEHKKYLRPLAEMLMLAVGKEIYCKQGYLVVFKEKEYFQMKKKGKEPIFLCLHDGYASFEAKVVCEIMERDFDIQDCTSIGLGKELSFYSLAKVDKEGKQCMHWSTIKRFFHVRVKDLIELTNLDYLQSEFYCKSTLDLFRC